MDLTKFDTVIEVSPRALSLDEACKVLGVSRTHVFSLMKSGELKSFKIGARRLFRYSDLEAFINKHFD
jgi:excisionase family DNA binding protein